MEASGQTTCSLTSAEDFLEEYDVEMETCDEQSFMLGEFKITPCVKH